MLVHTNISVDYVSILDFFANFKGESMPEKHSSIQNFHLIKVYDIYIKVVHKN